MLIIRINGIEYRIQYSIPIYYLLEFLSVNLNAIALEHNDLIVQKDDYKSIFLKDKDRIEIVSIVGGG